METLVGFVLQTSISIVLAAIRVAFVLGAVLGQLLRFFIPYIARAMAGLARAVLRLLSKVSNPDVLETRPGSSLRRSEDRKVAEVSRHDETKQSQTGRRRNAAKIYW